MSAVEAASATERSDDEGRGRWLAILALAAFILSLMIGSYAMTYGVMVSAFVMMTGYLIAIGRFDNRMDPE